MRGIEFEHSTISFDSSVIFIVFKKGAKMDVASAREMIVSAEKLSDKKPYLMFSDIRNHVEITPEARKVAADKKEAPLIIANAVLTDNVALKLTANFFVKINRPHFPVKLFTDRSKAMLWLKQFNRQE
ncbi:MAG: hypothetical protein K0Q95_545 [Bacteroidota bacterium]|jgi:hypothetical protein|nr:hypothetical protein [Bacteroidota bacterium]